jgi:hypothetical protein
LGTNTTAKAIDFLIPLLDSAWPAGIWMQKMEDGLEPGFEA